MKYFLCEVTIMVQAETLVDAEKIADDSKVLIALALESKSVAESDDDNPGIYALAGSQAYEDT